MHLLKLNWFKVSFSMLMVCLLLPTFLGATEAGYFSANEPIPVFSSPDIMSVFGGEGGRGLKMDSSGLVRELEFIALPGTVFEIKETLRHNGNVIYRVVTSDYPYKISPGLFVDSRFQHSVLKKKPLDRVKKLPPMRIIIRNLLAARGERYVWGGNVRSGMPKMLEYYPYKGTMSPRLLGKWTLDGVDCSGLLYEATDGYTPRNTSSLIEYGSYVSIEGFSASEIASMLEPLDLIVWKGHVMIALDKENIIESRLQFKGAQGGRYGGVRVRAARAAIEELMGERKPVDDYFAPKHAGNKRFVLRRWHK